MVLITDFERIQAPEWYLYILYQEYQIEPQIISNSFK